MRHVKNRKRTMGDGFLGLVCVLAFVCFPLRAETQSQSRLPLVAVLELQGQNIPPEALRLWTDAVRTVAIQTLGPTARVLTPGNQELILRENGVDTGAICEAGACDVDLLRTLDADYGLAGTVTRLDTGAYWGVLTLYETGEGTALGAENFEGLNDAALIDVLRVKTSLLIQRRFGRRGGVSSFAVEERLGGTAIPLPAVGQAAVFVSLSSEPAGAMVLDGDEPVCSQTPCKKRFSQGVHELRFVLPEHRAETVVVDVKAGIGPVHQKLTATYATLLLSVTPSDARLKLDNERFINVYEENQLKLAPGAHEIWVDDPCYVRAGERVVLTEGVLRRVNLVAKPHLALIEVLAIDDRGNDVQVDVYADGVRLGDNSKAIQVPVCTQRLDLDAYGKKAPVRLPRLSPGQKSVIRANIGGALGTLVTTKSVVRLPRGTEGLAWRVGDKRPWKLVAEQSEFEISAGPLEVQLALPGKEPETRAFDVAPGRVYRLEDPDTQLPFRPEWKAKQAREGRLWTASSSLLVPVLGAVTSAFSVHAALVNHELADTKFGEYEATKSMEEGLRLQQEVEAADAAAALWTTGAVGAGLVTAAAIALPIWLFSEVGEEIEATDYPPVTKAVGE